MRARRIWIGAGVTVVVLVLAAGGILWRFMSRAMYEPGAAHALGAALQPPAQDGTPAGFWMVAPGIRLRHFETGTGTDVLVVHGGPGYPPVRPWAATAFTGDSVHWVFYQQRGCGESTRPIDRLGTGNRWREIQRAEHTLGLAAQVGDIERIRRILGQDRLVLVGHSFGAIVAALYAAEFPEHVRALVFVSPAPLMVMPPEPPDIFEAVSRRLPPALAADYATYRKQYFDFRRLLGMDEKGLSAFYAGFNRFYGAAMGAGAAPASAVGAGAAPASSVGAGAAPASAMGAGAAPASAIGGPAPEPGGWTTVALYLSMGRRHDWRAALAPVTVPVLVLHGADDLQTESQSRGFGALFPHARLDVIPGAGHFSFDQQPRDFAARLVAFLHETS